MRKMIIGCIITLVILGGCAQGNSQPAQSTQGEAPTPQQAPTASQTAVKNDGKEEPKFPQKPLEIVIGVSTGGTADITARIIAAASDKYFGQPMAVVSKPGGSQAIGMGDVLNSSPDGYKIGLPMSSALTIVPHTAQTTYSHDGFEPIAGIADIPMIFAVKADSPWKTFDEWVEYVKQHPNEFTLSVAGINTEPALIMEEMSAKLGLQVKIVPYEGGGPAATALLGGHVDGNIQTISGIGKYIESGDFRALTFNGNHEDAPPYLKDVPTVDDLGLDLKTRLNMGIIAPKGIPQETLEILQGTFKQILEDPEVISSLKKADVQVQYVNPGDYKNSILTLYDSNEDILKNIGVKK